MNNINKTPIEWVQNPDGTPGYTWNPITGCLYGCSYCYARKLAKGRLKNIYKANKNIAHICPVKAIGGICFAGNLDPSCDECKARDPFYPRLWPERLYHAMPLKKSGIFCCDMSDLFGIGVPKEWTRLVLHQIRLYFKHRFYLLTKQPQNLVQFSPFPDNCWVGVSVCNQAMLEKSIKDLMQIKAKVRFISFEPLQGPINLTVSQGIPGNYINALTGARYFRGSQVETMNKIDWVIIGAQTRPYRPPELEWTLNIVNAADRVGVPVFLKNNLNPLLQGMLTQEVVDGGLAMKHPENSSAWKLRQEIPEGRQ